MGHTSMASAAAVVARNGGVGDENFPLKKEEETMGTFHGRFSASFVHAFSSPPLRQRQLACCVF